MMNDQGLRGTFTALVTPFTNSGDVDYDGLIRLIDFQIAQGISGLVICGTTGEKSVLTVKEVELIAERAIAKIDKRVVSVFGTGTNNTEETLNNCQKAAKIGYDYALTVCPYYNKPTQRGLYEHFKHIADLSEIPIILYNVPGRTSCNLTTATCLELSRHENIHGVKEASGNLDQIGGILAERRKGFSVLSGDDGLTLPILSLGADGVISVVSNEIPKPMTKMVDLCLKGDFREARTIHYRYQELFGANFIESNPVPVKYLLAKMGLIEATVRLPLVELSSSSKTILDRLLHDLELSVHI